MRGEKYVFIYRKNINDYQVEQFFWKCSFDRFLQTDIGEIRIFSRDEKKQDDMRHEYQAKMPEVADKIKFYIGDVRDLNSVRLLCRE